MGTLRHSWAAQLLVWLLRDGDGPALLGDLAEEHARRSQAGNASEAAQCYRYQLYASLTAVLRRRLLEWVRAVPWGTTAAAYGVVVVLELGSVWLLSLLWPGVAHATSALRLVMEFPGIVAIAYVATRVHRQRCFRTWRVHARGGRPDAQPQRGSSIGRLRNRLAHRGTDRRCAGLAAAPTVERGCGRHGVTHRDRQRARAGGDSGDRPVEDHLWREELARPARARRLRLPHRQMGR